MISYKKIGEPILAAVVYTKNGENSPAFAARKDGREDSEHEDPLPSLWDPRRLSFIFQYKEWKEWGGFSSVSSKDAEDSSRTGEWGGFSCIPSRKKVGESCVLPFSHLYRAAMGEIGRTLCSFEDSGFYREDHSELYQKKDNGVREVLINT